MTPLVQYVTTVLSVGVIIADIAIIIFFFLLFTARQSTFAQAIFTFISEYGIVLGFLITLAAVLTSLFYSNIAGFTPCDLCWWQRIFIFPQFILFAAALYRKIKGFSDNHIFGYSGLLSLIGALIAVYHTYGQSFANSILFCNSSAVSCSKLYFMTFGYISIPVMSLTGFLLLLVIVISRKVAQY